MLVHCGAARPKKRFQRANGQASSATSTQRRPDGVARHADSARNMTIPSNMYPGHGFQQLPTWSLVPAFSISTLVTVDVNMRDFIVAVMLLGVVAVGVSATAAPPTQVHLYLTGVQDDMMVPAAAAARAATGCSWSAANPRSWDVAGILRHAGHCDRHPGPLRKVCHGSDEHRVRHFRIFRSRRWPHVRGRPIRHHRFEMLP